MSEIGEEIYKARPLTSTFVVAHLWLSRGFGLIPIQPNSKKIIKSFGPVAGQVVQAAEVEFWFRDRNLNIAVVADESHVILDFDEIEKYDQFRAGWPDLVTYCEETPRGGRHLFFALEDGQALHAPSLVTGIEIKKFVLVHPSQIGGVRYEILDPSAIRAVPRERLLAALRPFYLHADKCPDSPVLPLLDGPRPSQGQKISIRANDGVIEQARQRWPILSYWLYFGYDLKLRGEGRWRSGRCPFHSPDAHPSFWVDVDHGRWGCHAENIQGDVVDFHARRLGTDDQAQAARDLLTYDVRFSI